MMGNYFGNMWGFGWIPMLIFWGLIIWAIFALVRAFGGHNGFGSNHGESRRWEKNAMDILKERYAKGEISQEEFEKMKKNLE